MIKIKLTIPGAPSNINLSQFTGNDDNIHNGCQFFVNDDVPTADFWFVLEGADSGQRICSVRRGGFIFLSAETAWPLGHFVENQQAADFLRQFDQIFTCHETLLSNATSTPPFLPWMVNSNHGHTIFDISPRNLTYFEELESLEKSKKLSVICSAQSFTPEHRMRYRFVAELKEHFKDKMDWYGNGVHPLNTKWEGLAPYKYSIAIENNFRRSVLSEKLIDSFLTLTLPIYWGSPAASEIFPEESMVPIDIFDLSGSKQIIEKLLDEDPYEARIHELVKAKDIALTDFHFLTRITDIAKMLYPTTAENRRVELIPLSNVEVSKSPSHMSTILKKVGTRFFNLADKL